MSSKSITQNQVFTHLSAVQALASEGKSKLQRTVMQRLTPIAPNPPQPVTDCTPFWNKAKKRLLNAYICIEQCACLPVLLNTLSKSD